MKIGENKYDHIAREFTEQSGLEKPSSNLTDRIMDQVYAYKNSKAGYNPMIGVKGWITIATGICGIVVLALLSTAGSADQTERIFKDILFSKLNIAFSKFDGWFENINIPSYLILGFLMILILLYLDIFYADYYSNKKRELI